MSVLSKHGVDILHAGPFQVSVLPVDQPPIGRGFGAGLESWVSQQQRAGKDLTRDLERNRMGIVRMVLADGVCMLHTAPLSWAHIQVAATPDLIADIPMADRFWTLCGVVLIISSDSKLILSRRSRKVATHHDHWSVTAAGYVDAKPVADTHLFQHGYRELQEEVGLGPDDIPDSFTQLGLCIHPPGRNTYVEGLLFAHSVLSAQDILERASTATDSWEGKHFACTREEATQLLMTGKLHPPAAATLALYLGYQMR